jgi:hypothetical protein
MRQRPVCGETPVSGDRLCRHCGPVNATNGASEHRHFPAAKLIVDEIRAISLIEGF